MKECSDASKRGGTIARNARLELEKETGKKVVSNENYLELTKKNGKRIKHV